MLLLIWLFMPGITSFETEIDGHTVTNNENVITYVKRISKSSDTLNIIRTFYIDIDQKAFNDVQHLKNLTVQSMLGRVNLPPLVFLQLKNLEVLHIISDSSITTEKAFVGLNKLKKLIVTPGIYSSYRIGEKMNFLGLPRTTKIMFGSEPFSIPKQLLEAKLEPYRLVCFNKNNYVTSLKRVDDLDELRTAARKCDRFDLIDNYQFESGNRINLRYMRIRGFERDWFGLEVGRRVYLDLSANKIDRIQAEMLNHLPLSNWTVDLSWNGLKELRKGFIGNENLKGLIVARNYIEKIEEHALKHTDLRIFNVSNNQLNNINFVKTLPPSIAFLYLNDNNITKLLPNDFLGPKKLLAVLLHGNKLEKLEKYVFEGLQRLRDFTIYGNNLKDITTDSFHGLPKNIIKCLCDNEFRTCRGHELIKLTCTGTSNLKHIIVKNETIRPH